MPSINDPHAKIDYKKPRFRAMMNGVEIPFCIKASVSNNNFYQADKYSCEFWLYADPKFDAKFWGEQEGVLVDIQMAIVPNAVGDTINSDSYQSLVLGVVDKVSVHPTSGIVSINGRDLTSNFIDTKIQEAFQNMTASDIAIKMAAGHNMTANVVATTGLAGALYDRDHTKLNDSHFSKTTSEWDLLTYLAKQQDPPYDCYVRGTTLYFRPPAQPTDDSWTIYLGAPQSYTGQDGNNYIRFPESNVNDLRLDRSLTLAKDVQVTVESYDSENDRPIKAVIKSHNTSSPGKSDPRGTPTQNYTFRVNGVSQDQALKLAKAHAEEITKHERLISWMEPGDLRLTPQMMVNLIGTNSSWDQQYFIDSIDRSISIDGGFIMNVRAKNHSVVTETVE